MRVILLIVLIFWAALVPLKGIHAAALCPEQKNASEFSLEKEYDYEDIRIKRVVDGDTLVLENEEWVRLIGIDTPEVFETQKLYRDAKRTNQDVRVIKEMGRKASRFTKKLLDGKRVRLEFDTERKDKYGRLLAYVYLKDGTFVNAEIVSSGYASLMTIPPNVRYADQLRDLYQQARENRKGLWGGK